MKLLPIILVIFFLYSVFPDLIRSIYSDHGHGDQHLTFWVVFGALLSPLLWPVLHTKTLVLNIILPALNLDWVESHLMYTVGRALLTPRENFDPVKLPPKPDYDNEDYWSMFPNRTRSAREDAADHAIGELFNGDDQPNTDTEKICSAFYLHPSTWYTSVSWNAEALHPVTSYLSDDAIGPQHANAFNSVCRVFAPRFRQMAAAGFLQIEGLENSNSKQALAVAYLDVKAAFEHFLKNYHKGEPIIIVGHSQGSLLGHMLVQEFFDAREDLFRYFGAAYLPGWTLFEEDYKHRVKVCREPEDIGCVISWRTFARGGNVRAFLHVEPKTPDHKPICTNPLSWKSDSEYVPEHHNMGGLDVMHYLTMWRYLIGYKSPKDRVRPPPLIPRISDAQCVDGHLMVSPPRHYGYGWGLWPFPAWTFASFPGQNLHTYDFNFFFANLRHNVRQRMEAWYQKTQASPPKP